MEQNTSQSTQPFPDIVAVAMAVEAKLHEALNTFELSGARLYGANIAGRDVAEPNLCFLSQHPDVYELLDTPSSALARMFDSGVVVTTGWAAPLSADGSIEGAPSEHAERRRVRLVVAVADHGVASVLRFADEPDNVISDPGSATGSLADAIHRFWFDPPINLPAGT